MRSPGIPLQMLFTVEAMRWLGIVATLAITALVAAMLTTSLHAQSRKPFARCGEPVVGGAPNWSPDGKDIAYWGVTSKKPFVSSIWRVRSDGTHRQRMAQFSQGVSPYFPVWSPDGQTIAFGNAQHEVFTVPAAGGTPQFLTNGDQPGWFPDGKQLVVLRMPPPGNPYLRASFVVVTAAGEDVRSFYTRAGEQWSATPNVSPDGTSIVYGAWHDGRGGSLRIIGADGSNDHWLDPNIEGSFPLYGEFPRWSPDGSTIAFTNVDVEGDFDAVHTYIQVVRKNGLSVDGVATGISPTWSPDGSRIAFVHRDGDGSARSGQIWIADRNGNALHPIAPGCAFGTGHADRITPGVQARAVYAFGGNDLIRARDGRREYIDCGRGRDRVVADARDVVTSTCEVVTRRRRT